MFEHAARASLGRRSDNRRRSEQSAKFHRFCVSVRGFRNFGPFSGSVSIFLVCFTCRLGPQCDLDGTLYIDKDGSPWLIYAREWIEVENGEIYAQRLSEDLKQMLGNPILLCRGSDSDWAGLIITGFQDRLLKPLGHLSSSFSIRGENYPTILSVRCQ